MSYDGLAQPGVDAAGVRSHDFSRWRRTQRLKLWLPKSKKTSARACQVNAKRAPRLLRDEVRACALRLAYILRGATLVRPLLLAGKGALNPAARLGATAGACGVARAYRLPDNGRRPERTTLRLTVQARSGGLNRTCNFQPETFKLLSPAHSGGNFAGIGAGRACSPLRDPASLGSFPGYFPPSSLCWCISDSTVTELSTVGSCLSNSRRCVSIPQKCR